MFKIDPQNHSFSESRNHFTHFDYNYAYFSNFVHTYGFLKVRASWVIQQKIIIIMKGQKSTDFEKF